MVSEALVPNPASSGSLLTSQDGHSVRIRDGDARRIYSQFLPIAALCDRTTLVKAEELTRELCKICEEQATSKASLAPIALVHLRRIPECYTLRASSEAQRARSIVLCTVIAELLPAMQDASADWNASIFQPLAELVFRVVSSAMCAKPRTISCHDGIRFICSCSMHTHHVICTLLVAYK